MCKTTKEGYNYYFLQQFTVIQITNTNWSVFHLMHSKGSMNIVTCRDMHLWHWVLAKTTGECNLSPLSVLVIQLLTCAANRHMP